METYQNKLTIKNWAEEDRPREKLLLKGKSSLSDAELLAILIRSGSRDISAVDLSKHILSQSKNDLNLLARESIQDLSQHKGIGEAKAIAIVAALELGRRRQSSTSPIKLQVKSSKSAFDFIKSQLMDLTHEEFWVIYLNRANKITNHERISAGGVTGTIVDVKMVLKSALQQLASSIILVHNHPSGNIRPSQADMNLTKKMVQASSLMDIQVLDHLIIGENSYYSFADDGAL